LPSGTPTAAALGRTALAVLAPRTRECMGTFILRQIGRFELFFSFFSQNVFVSPYLVWYKSMSLFANTAKFHNLPQHNI
jgi:hypothetical protein